MNWSQKLKALLSGLGMIACGIALEYFGEGSIPFIITIYGFLILLSGLKYLIYYLSMARFMVGGQSVFYRALLLLDLATYSLFVVTVPKNIIILYLIGLHLFMSAVDILGSLEAKRLGAASWRERLFSGLYNVGISVWGIFSFQTPSIMVSIYCMGLISAGVIRIASSFRKTASIYIP